MTREYTTELPIMYNIKIMKKMLLQATIAEEQAQYTREDIWCEHFGFKPT